MNLSLIRSKIKPKAKLRSINACLNILGFDRSYSRKDLRSDKTINGDLKRSGKYGNGSVYTEMEDNPTKFIDRLFKEQMKIYHPDIPVTGDEEMAKMIIAAKERANHLLAWRFFNGGRR